MLYCFVVDFGLWIISDDVQRLLLALYLGISPDVAWGLYGILRIEARTAECKVSSLSAMLLPGLDALSFMPPISALITVWSS